MIISYNTMSSANMLISLPGEMVVTILLIYIINSRGPSILPCGTPDTTGSLLDITPSTATT